MADPTSFARHALWLLMAALASLTGSAVLLKMGSAVGGQPSGVPESGLPALGLFALVVLLGLGGVVLAAMAAKEYLDHRRQTHLQ